MPYRISVTFQSIKNSAPYVIFIHYLPALQSITDNNISVAIFIPTTISNLSIVSPSLSPSLSSLNMQPPFLPQSDNINLHPTWGISEPWFTYFFSKSSTFFFAQNKPECDKGDHKLFLLKNKIQAWFLNPCTANLHTDSSFA